MPQTPNSSILALDVGAGRIGIALASRIARIAHPYGVLANDEQFIELLSQLVLKEDVDLIVVGLPRGLEGQETAQTKSVRAFVEALQERLALPVHFQDEALTSRQAEAELNARGKIYQKGDIDALAATYILEDYLNQPGGNI